MSDKNLVKQMRALDSIQDNIENDINTRLGEQENIQHEIEKDYYADIFSNNKSSEIVKVVHGYLFGPDGKTVPAKDPNQKDKIMFINQFFGYTPSGQAYTNGTIPQIEGGIPNVGNVQAAWKIALTYLTDCCTIQNTSAGDNKRTWQNAAFPRGSLPPHIL